MPKVRVRSRLAGEAPAITPIDEGTDGPDLGSVLAGGAGAVGAALLAKKVGLGKIFKVANDVRQQLMLSGLAVPKSVLGNVGATAIASAERRSMAPLKELFSRRTLRDVKAAYNTNTPYPGATRLPGPTPGRIMGAFDDATQNAMQRAGMSPAESAREVLQAPLPGPLAEALDSEAARYMIPFRRTPFNQFLEGFKTISKDNIRKNPALMGTVAGAGATHGAATSDDRYPMSIGLGAAASARYGVPYILAAIAGRKLAGGRTSAGLAGTTLPVSEYGITTSIEDPLQPFRKPAALTALERLLGE